MIQETHSSLGWSNGNSRAILHIDADGFFAACEVALNPALRGKCVVTGAERGIASAMTYEAKARGVKRGMPLHAIRRVCPEAVILESNYETYAVFSGRMYSIVRRYTEAVEEYSIDECFADLTGLRRPLHMSYEDIARTIKRDLQNELGFTFSLGLAPNKVLAKLGSKWQKPDGFTRIYKTEVANFLVKTNCENVLGIGSQTTALLSKHGIITAHDFACKDEKWVTTHLTKPHLELWRELNTEFVLPLNFERKHNYQSIQKTKTFTPSTNDQNFLLSQLSKNCEDACSKARRYKLYTKRISFFLKTQQFRYRSIDINLPSSTAFPNEIMKIIQENFQKVFRLGEMYRTTGVTLHELSDTPPSQLDLFGANSAQAKVTKVFERIDNLATRYGKRLVSLGSSMRTLPSDIEVVSPRRVLTDRIFDVTL